MAVICPSVTPSDLHQYRQQLEKVIPFAKRVHLDFMDGKFVSTVSPLLESIWLPENVQVDIHLMYKTPGYYLQTLLKLKPHLVIVHAEADGDYDEIAKQLHACGIKAGVALLPTTPVLLLRQSIGLIDHILIFSGNLGHYGGKADLGLLGKVSEAKALKPGVEVGWDGGINEENARTIINNGVDVLNTGGFIQNRERPQEAYATLMKIAEEVNHR
jgi:ribulose-phosphate 3-epimerase